VLTSFSAGIPTIATNIAGTNEAVIHEKTGLLVPMGDDRALADAIARLFEDDALCTQLVKNGEQIITDKFSWDAHLAILTQIFDGLVIKKITSDSPSPIPRGG
jgi:glycosyltransferase involved in cell wall biosynthesis